MVRSAMPVRPEAGITATFTEGAGFDIGPASPGMDGAGSRAATVMAGRKSCSGWALATVGGGAVAGFSDDGWGGSGGAFEIEGVTGGSGAGRREAGERVNTDAAAATRACCGGGFERVTRRMTLGPDGVAG